MRALVFERSLPRYAAAAVAGRLRPGGGARVGPLRLAEIDEPALPGPGWHRVRPRLAGICGSDLATIDGRSSRYFEPIVSFPFVPGHEVVGEMDDGTRVVVQPVLTCATRRVDPPCASCLAGETGDCEMVAFGHLEPGLQTGYCADTGGGWGQSLVVHDSQLHRVPEELPDEAAVLVEPTACAVHAARTGLAAMDGGVVAVLGAGTLGLLTIAAVRRLGRPRTIVATAKHPEQRRLARALGADTVVEPDELRRAIRLTTRSLETAALTGGADLVFDCVGTSDTIGEAIAVVRPRGTVSLVGMPGTVSVDLTPLWHREVRLTGSYAYRRDDFLDAFDLVATADLGRLVSARYPLDRYREAIEHAATAGGRGAVKIAFDLTQERRR